jgi:nitroimidazol reductase NimA-like FMN-containing flavoprotein (pyridoxamine 5'-phosphate oxidase superfamily)
VGGDATRGDRALVKVSRTQLRMTGEELERFLAESRYGRLATANREAEPHVTPLGYVYHDGAIWFHALRGGRRDRDLAENPKVAFLVDDGLGPEYDYNELRGAIVYGTCAVADDDVQLDEVRHAFMRAMGAQSVAEIQRRTHSWYRLDFERTSSWDFRKIPEGADRKAR